MKRILVLILSASLTLSVTAAPYDVKGCKAELQKAGVSLGYNETIAHTIHSMTVQGLRMFNPRATENNKVPTVNHDLSAQDKVLPYAPHDPVGVAGFATPAMNLIDKILTGIGSSNDGLGPNWSAIERVVHHFHMQDVWSRVKQEFPKVEKAPPTEYACSCLLDTDANGIRDAVQWVADHYSHATPITLLNRPIPKLTDAASWLVWRSRLLHYYDAASLFDAATYLYCVTKDM